jgi:hypothetical protein
MALGLAAAVGPGFWIVAFVIGFIARPRFTRHVRTHRDFGDVVSTTRIRRFEF